jgi:hypothetical protein
VSHAILRLGQSRLEQDNVHVGCVESRDTSFRLEVIGTVVAFGKSFRAIANENATLPGVPSN